MYTEETQLNYLLLRISWGLHRDNLQATRQRIHSPAVKRVATKLATPVTRRNEKAGQAVSYWLFRHLTDELMNCSNLLRVTYWPY